LSVVTASLYLAPFSKILL